jgi:8-oxo-dGTP pyrophosphatase MutT (NUDIX family)
MKTLLKNKPQVFEAVLCFLRRRHRGRNSVLLGVKTRKIGKGLRNGYGGGIHVGETAIDAMIREFREEGKVHIAPEDLEKIAIVDFHNNKNGCVFVARVHIFIAWKWTGSPQATLEMSDPRWFGICRLPLGKMMAADRHIIPVILADTSHNRISRKYRAVVHYGPEQKTLLSPVKIRRVAKLP